MYVHVRTWRQTDGIEANDNRFNLHGYINSGYMYFICKSANENALGR